MHFKKTLLENALHWFQPEILRAKLVSPIESQFPNYPLPSEIQAIVFGANALLELVKRWPGDPMTLADVGAMLSAADPSCHPLFKQIVLHYRRHRAAYTESKTEMTFHPELLNILQEEVKVLDALVSEDWFQKIEPARLPRLKDFLPVQYIESESASIAPLAPREYDEKFHILQAPALFLLDLAYFRAKCEDRDTELAIGFLDIDNFKRFNTDHSETKIDRNLLPRFMQTMEAHLFHHGFAYRQGGDEYLILIPSLSRKLCVAFLDELRTKLAGLEYLDIKENTTVSIGLCMVDPDCPLTDRELLGRANRAKEFAKKNGRNCIAAYCDRRLMSADLSLVVP